MFTHELQKYIGQLSGREDFGASMMSQLRNRSLGTYSGKPPAHGGRATGGRSQPANVSQADKQSQLKERGGVAGHVAAVGVGMPENHPRALVVAGGNGGHRVVDIRA